MIAVEAAGNYVGQSVTKGIVHPVNAVIHILTLGIFVYNHLRARRCPAIKAILLSNFSKFSFS